VKKARHTTAQRFEPEAGRTGMALQQKTVETRGEAVASVQLQDEAWLRSWFIHVHSFFLNFHWIPLTIRFLVHFVARFAIG
jgi:hypothetical protein